MSNNNSNLKTNTTSLQELLTVVNNLPEASNGVELPTLTNEGTAADLLSGKELIDGEGNVVTGTFTIDEELTTQETLLSDQDAKLAELAEILSNKASVSPVLQSKTVTPTTAEQTVTADSGYDGLRAVTVNGDENLVAENIAEGVSIFGVEGSHSGGSGSAVETCTVTITTNNTMTIIYSTVNESGASTTMYDHNNMEEHTLEIVCGSLVFVPVVSTIPGYTVSDGAEYVENLGGYLTSRTVVFKITATSGQNVTINCYDDD